MITRIKNGRLILSDKYRGEYLYIKDDKIADITDMELPYDREIDAEGDFVSAGFIDIHVHGGGGADFMDGGADAIMKASELHLAHGTTSILPTSLACSDDVLIGFLNDVRDVMTSGMCRSNILGVHLEGPYFSLNQSGAQNPDYIKAPRAEEYMKILEAGEGIIRRWSFAPELDGAEEFCRVIAEKGISPSIGHSDAVYADVEQVYSLGCRAVTHLYSGMSTITRKNGFRRLGVIESVYLLDGMMAEIIADGKHLPPELLKLIVKQLGTDNICLVTDAMRGAGMPDGESLLGRLDEGMVCIIEDGVAKLSDRSAFAGSVATADRLIRTMVQSAGVSVCEAVKMMTVNPASMLGMKNKGRLNVACDADIVIFDESINIKKVIIRGKEI